MPGCFVALMYRQNGDLTNLLKLKKKTWKIYLSGLEKVGMEPGIAQQFIVSTFNLIFTSPPVSESAKKNCKFFVGKMSGLQK